MAGRGILRHPNPMRLRPKGKHKHERDYRDHVEQPTAGSPVERLGAMSMLSSMLDQNKDGSSMDDLQRLAAGFFK